MKSKKIKKNIIGAFLRNRRFCEKSKYFILSVYVVFVYAACEGHVTCYIVICGLSGSTTFSHFPSHKRHDFRTKAFGAKIGFLIFSKNLSKLLLFWENLS